MKRTISKFGLLALTIALLAGVIGVASAQDGEPRGPRGDRDRQFGQRIVNREFVQIVVDATGLEPRELAQRVRNGETLADVIIASGADVDAVIVDMVSHVNARINAAVEEGNITQERADQMLEQVEPTITAIVNGEFEFGDRDRNREGMPGMNLLRSAINDMAELTGQTPQEIREALRNGTSLNEQLVAAGADVDDFVADQLASVETALSDAVANGRITQERADDLLANVTDRLPDLLDWTPGARRNADNSI